MCELLVMAIDRMGDDANHDAKQPKRGDVITIQPDGWRWGTAELNSEVFRVLAFPGVDAEQFGMTLSWERPRTPLPARHGSHSLDNGLKFRTHHINLDHPVIAPAFDGHRKHNVLVVAADSAEVVRPR